MGRLLCFTAVIYLLFIIYLFLFFSANGKCPALPSGNGSCWNLACWLEVGIIYECRSQMGTNPQTKFLGLKLKNFERGAYISELISLECKWISECLKLPWNQKKTAYKMNVRPWPLTSGCKHGKCLYIYTCENFMFFDSLKIFCCNPRQTFTVDRSLCDLQVWKISWTLVHKWRWMLQLKNVKFSRSE